MYVIANWKMNGLRREAEVLARDVAEYLHGREEESALECVICPPATLLHAVAGWAEAEEQVFAVGGQDCRAEAAGAYTGDISAAMLKDAGAEYVILGHSERRRHHGETDAQVAAKARAARAAGLIPVICIGETLEHHETHRTLEVIEAQTAASVPDGLKENVILAYEPVWAIGSGNVPGPGEIEVTHSAVIATLTEKKGIAPEQISVLYGGSVKAENAPDILRIPGVGGALVGGASLNAREFCRILAAVR